MLKFSHAVCVGLAGLLWLAIGLFLLPLGLKLIIAASQSDQLIHYPILDNLAFYVGGYSQAALILIAACLLVGYFKSKYVLTKSIQRMVKRIRSLPAPVPVQSIYSIQFYLLIGLMIMLGMLIKYFNVVADVRGAVDVIVGAALINGAVTYFRTALAISQESGARSQ